MSNTSMESTESKKKRKCDELAEPSGEKSEKRAVTKKDMKPGFILTKDQKSGTVTAIKSGFRRKTFSDKDLSQKKMKAADTRDFVEIMNNYKIYLGDDDAEDTKFIEECIQSQNWVGVVSFMSQKYGSVHIGNDVARKNSKFIVYIQY